ncbi:MAG: hypothetical protein WCF22_18620 [Candidatus Sulfotelmatobacter sp.]
MKRLLLVALSLGLIPIGSAWAQSHPQPATKSDTGARSAAIKPILISGRVSGDGRHFSTDRESDPESGWDVSNARILKGHEGSLVTVKCYLDAGRNQIQILSVNRVQPEVR